MDEREDPLVSRTLDGRIYTLNPSELQMASSGSWFTKTMSKVVLGVLLFPIWFPISILVFGTLWLAPKAMRMRFLGYFLPPIMNYLDHKFHNTRSLLLDNIQGRVLDVGCGSGAYFRYFTQADEIVAIEPADTLHTTIRQQAQACGVLDRLTITTTTVECYLANNQEYFDWIILGNVLCEVDDPISTLQSVRQLLRPGTGRLYFSEHVARTDWLRPVQNMLNPFWNVISVGCNINRDSLRYIESVPRLEVISWQYPNCTVGMGPIVVGLARRVP